MTPEEAIKLLRSGGASCRIWINREAVADVIEQQQKQIQMMLFDLEYVLMNEVYLDKGIQPIIKKYKEVK